MITIAKTSGSFWQYHKDDPNDTKSKFLLIQIQDKSNRKNTGNTKDVQIAMPFKYLSNFWKALDIPLINFEVNITLTCSEKCVITNSIDARTFEITDTKLYVPVVNLSTQYNTKLLEQLKPGLKRKIIWNKYQSNVPTQAKKQYLYYLIDCFQGANRLFGFLI